MEGKIVHTKITKESHRFRSFVESKAEVVGKIMGRTLLNHNALIETLLDKHSEESTGELLLKLRRALSDEIKNGMLDRKDREIEIAALAFLILMGRMTLEEKQVLLGEW
jgi:hypothetical protein